MTLSPKIQFTLLIVLITISSIQPVTTLPIGNTIFWWFVNTASVVAILRTILAFGLFSTSSSKPLLFIKLLLIWYLICVVRGFFVANNYWEWKNLISTSFTMMLPLVAFLALSPKFVKYITQQWLIWMLPLFFLFLPFLIGDGIGRYLIPVSMFLLFFPILSKKWKLILLFFFFVVLMSSLAARSNIIKFTVSLIMGWGLYVGLYQWKNILSLLWGSLMLLPFVLVILGATGTFNIFKMDEYIGGGENKVIVQDGEEVNLTADTRTFIYQEVINSAIKHNYYIWGRTPARGNESETFGWQNKELLDVDSNERFANEVSIANIFTWTGLVGVLLYFLVFMRASYLAIFRSRNQYIRVVGLYLGFRWCYAWVEDFTNFDLSYLFLWILIGMCISNKFRQMDERAFKIWSRGIFDKRYRTKKKNYTILKNRVITYTNRA